MKVSKGAGVINTQPPIHAMTAGKMWLEHGCVCAFVYVCERKWLSEEIEGKRFTKKYLIFHLT